jgi:alpha-L-fucosidase 2
MSDLTLWYNEPASGWTEALPLGNGRLGAMVFGGIEREQLQLNEDTIYSGGPYSQINPDARGRLDEVRQLIFEGSYALAEALTDRFMMGVPIKQMSYQPAGDLWLEFPHAGATGYRRSLDLDTAIATTRYTVGGVTYEREAFASAAHNVLVLRVRASEPGALSFGVGLTSQQLGVTEAETEDTLAFAGTNRNDQGIKAALRFAMRARVVAEGGRVARRGAEITIEGADSAVVLLDIGTSFRRFDDVSGDPESAVSARFEAAANIGYDALRSEHVAEHQRLFRRLSIDLGGNGSASLPTHERVAANPGKPDPALAALYVQYGRYLMISSSRPGTQPANLQGIWNDLTDPPWGCKYTSNINIEMNYWLPDPANIAECFEPLIALIEDLAESGREMAREHYGARGWVLHHNTDLWRATGPVDGAKWGLWPTGGVWYCVQAWDHVAYAGNDDLVARLYPPMKGAAEFVLDVLQPLPGTDYLVTVPSLSPENIHPHSASLCAGPTMDNQLVRDLFTAVTEAAERLGLDESFRAELVAARNRIPPNRIGAAGQLQEWLEDWDMDVPEINHRHVSHLYGLYPSQQIDLDRTPELAAAARRSLEIRGDEATGWGIGWRINLWARLREGDHANGVLTRLLSPDRTYPNLFDAHPPFQIDGNFGGAVGILEMLVQSKPGELHLLPALPSAWPTGSVRGVRSRGGITVDLSWRDGTLRSATLSGKRGSIALRYGSDVRTVEITTDPARIDF